MDNVTRLLMQSSGGKKDSTYVDDVFSTYLYAGEDSSYRNINNGIDLAGEGGMVMVRPRNNTIGINVFDTARGASKRLHADADYSEATDTSRLDQFNSNGFRVNGNYSTNGPSNYNYASWSFRKTTGFFDVLTYTGNGSARTIAHSLGSVPGMIWIKKTSANDPWNVYHRSLDSSSPENYRIFLDEADARLSANTSIWNQTKPTSTHFSLGNNDQLNGNGATYVAYIFAGGKGTTDKAVEFDGTDDYLTVGSSSDLTMGTGDFTIECWLNKTAQTHKGVWQISGSTTGLETNNYGDTISLGYQSGVWQIYGGGGHQNSASYPIVANKWYHAAYVRSSGTSKLYIDGVEVISRSDTTNYSGTYMAIGGYYSINYLHNGRISNLRVVKGQALYTSNFSVPHDPYTTTSHGANSGNVKLLCCNGSTTTDSTVTPATITATGNPTVTTNNSIFDDTEANVFGEEGDQNIIKCGSYVGNGSATAGPEINLGWEPQWFLTKRTNGSADWILLDSMRGMPTGETDPTLAPNSNGAEGTGGGDLVDVSATGIKLKTAYDTVNGNGDTYIFLALRRPDGYVGKPPELGTGVFAMDTGSGSSTIPTFDSNFVVDYALRKEPATSVEWASISRLTGEKYLVPNSNAAQSNYGYFKWDSNLGFGTNFGSGVQAWMWKRHAGFDVVAYTGNQVAGRKLSHSLNSVPEMIWAKMMTGGTSSWAVYHKGLNNATNPQNWSLALNTNSAENGVETWQYTAPTSTHVTLGAVGAVNVNGRKYIAMLFSSVAGISKVGYYDGTGSTQTITTGFQPRFIIIKRSNSSENWLVFDTLRGWGAGNDKSIKLNDSAAQGTWDVGAPTSTGFTLVSNYNTTNASGGKYIYYAHA